MERTGEITNFFSKVIGFFVVALISTFTSYSET